VDELTMKILSSCMKMHELTATGITDIEVLKKGQISHQPQMMKNTEVIYLISPVENIVDAFIQDCKFKIKKFNASAHVYFTERIPDYLFTKIAESVVVKRFKSLVEVNISFIPLESRIFSLECEPSYSLLYSTQKEEMKCTEQLSVVADRLATVCCTLEEFPSIRYTKECEETLLLAKLLDQRLIKYKMEHSSLGESSGKMKSQLIILDRSFDVKTPLLHELTYECMTHDLLNITNNTYDYEGSDGGIIHAVLDDEDKLWEELKHKHIAEVSLGVANKLKIFSKLMDDSSTDETKLAMKNLSSIIKQLPHKTEEKARLTTHIQIAEDLMQEYSKIKSLCKVEQDLVVNSDVDEVFKYQMKNIVPLLLDKDMSNNNKTRLILLYILSKDGITSENLEKLIQHAQIPAEQAAAIKNMAMLNVQMVCDKKSSLKDSPQHNIRERTSEGVYESRRWVPLVKDIIEDSMCGKLNVESFPFLVDRNQNSDSLMTESNRFGNAHKDKTVKRIVPRLIIFILGGLTYSESRTVHEVMKEKNGWDVYIGADTHVITPSKFLEHVSKINA